METQSVQKSVESHSLMSLSGAAEAAVKVVRRSDVPTIHSVEVDGRLYQLGLLKNFRKNRFLNAFIPEQGRPSIGWVALKQNEVLEVHRHPIPSVIIITKGRGSLLDQSETCIEEGDVVCVPPGAAHGFIGRGEHGFWALSLQFEARGLYEDLANPLVDFGPRAAGLDFLNDLRERNEGYLSRFNQHAIFSAFKDGTYRSPERKARLVAALQVWSNHFHKMLLIRSATCDHASILNVFDEHLKDEFSHSEELSQERSSVEPPWDAQLYAACSWFVNQMTALDNVEKIVLVHMVTEVAATGFYAAAKDVLAQEAKNHIEAHAEHDCEHARMGTNLLQGLDQQSFHRLRKIQAQGWAMLDVILSRIHALGTSTQA